MRRFRSFLILSVLTLVALATLATIADAQSTLAYVAEGSPIGNRLARDAATKNIRVFNYREDAIRTESSNVNENQAVIRDQYPVYSSTDLSKHKYFITDLGTLGGSQSFAYAINDSGDIVGFSWITGDTSGHSFLYSNGTMRDLYPFNSKDVITTTMDINNAGQIAGGLVINGIYVPAILNSKTGDLALIGSLGGVTPYGFDGVATAINNLGNTAGYSYIDSVNRHAFLYSEGLMTDIDSFGGYSASRGINNQGVVVGFASDRQNGSARAFVYKDGSMAGIGPVTESYAYGVNSKNQVVGSFFAADQQAFHGFLYSDGAFADIGFADSPETDAFAINDNGQVVGITDIPCNSVSQNSQTNQGAPCVKYRQEGFLYDNGNKYELDNLVKQNSGWDLTWALDINNQGQIVGYGLVKGKFRAFLLTPAISAEQCKNNAWLKFGFTDQGQCIQFVNTGK